MCAYLDNNSTTITDPQVIQAIVECYQSGYGNPASQHLVGRRARKRLEEARDGIGAILGANRQSVQADRVIFTSGGTESNNLAIHGLRRNKQAAKEANEIVVSAIEHPSVLQTAQSRNVLGDVLKIAPVTRDGVVNVEALVGMLNVNTRCVSVMLGNHETGTLQPVSEIAAHCHAQEIPLHTDAVQVVGKLPVNFADLGVAAMTVSAHKFHGPPGIGVLIVKSDVQLQPLIAGGSQQLGLRPGTEPVALAVGMHRALEIWKADAEDRQNHMRAMIDRLATVLTENIDGLSINGHSASRLPHTLNVSFPNVDRQAMLLALDQAGVSCSTGAACSSGSSEPSHVLLSMGCNRKIVDSSLRFSVSAMTTRAEIDESASTILAVYQQLATIFAGKTGSRRLAN